MARYNLGLNCIRFTIGFDWPGCDVDVALQEIPRMMPERVKVGSDNTPTGRSVATAFDAIFERFGSYLNRKDPDLPVQVVESYGLMMGVAHVTFETFAEPERLPEIIEKTKKAIQRLVWNKFRYYRRGTTVGSRIGFVYASD